MPYSLTIEPDFDQGLVVLERDRTVFRSYVIRTEVDGLEVELDVFTRDDGEGVCQGVRVTGSESRGITSAIIRALPIATLIRQSRKSRLVMDPPEGEADLSTEGPPDPHGLRDRTPTKGKALDSDHLEAVSKTYRDAAAAGHRPTAHVARIAGVSRPTASKWIRAARDRGLLGEALPGRGGEA